jgi:hypothetical protein
MKRKRSRLSICYTQFRNKIVLLNSSFCFLFLLEKYHNFGNYHSIIGIY